MINFYYKWKALKGLRRKYRIDLATHKLLKDWVTDCIIDRKQENRRQELVELEGKMKEQELFLEWLKTRSVFKD